VPLILFGWPDMAAETTRYALEVPHLGSLVLTHSWNNQIRGLKDFAPQDRPDSTIVFWTFRIMVGLGLLMLLLGVWAAWARWRDELFRSKLLLRLAVLMGPAGLVALLAGWITTEVGRQPWVVYGVLRTADAVSPVPGGSVLASIVLFVIVYGIVFGAGVYYIAKLVRRGPDQTPPMSEGDAALSHRPMAAAGNP
jgi:cytochrome d ubiquinol oxidase subunit I